ncbi:MAG: hypothetical protein ACRBFS_24360 [Aureispira sp.]
MKTEIEALPPRISKANLCRLFGVSRIRYLRSSWLTDDFVTTRLALTIKEFNNRQQFTVLESMTIKKRLLELCSEQNPGAAA